MNSVVRYIDKDNPSDIHQLAQILKICVEEEKNKIDKVYHDDDFLKLTDWILETVKKVNIDDFIIFGEFTNDILEKIVVSYKWEMAWGKPKSEDFFPYWYTLLFFSKEKNWGTPKKTLHSILVPACEHFERQGFTKMYAVMKLPSKITKLEDANNYFNLKIFRNTIPITRYTGLVEHVFTTQEELDNFKFKAIKFFLPSKIVRPIYLYSITLNKTIYKS